LKINCKKMNNELNGEYWSKRYAENDAAWDVGRITEPMKAYIDQLTDKQATILIPGCGNAYEAEYLLENGFENVTLVDFSEVLIEQVRNKFADFKVKPTIILSDFFELDQQFDLILEQTFLSALHPSLRNKYADKLHDLLKKDGKVAGVIFDKDFPENPPFGGSKEEYEKLFAEKFEILKMEPCYNSIEPRAGAELFIILKKK
jgi:SAM-dependent methyltransferase